MVNKGTDKQTPKYVLLAESLRRDITEGRLCAGDKIPSENELTRTRDCSRQTVRQALDVLEREGALTRRQGSGTYVSFMGVKGNRTQTIGVITTYITDYIFPTIIRGIEEVLTRQGYQLSLGVTGNRVENEAKLLHSFLEKRVDGLIVEGTKTALPNPNLGLYRQLENMGIPCVFINGYYRELPCVSVVTNDRLAGFQAAEHLLHAMPRGKLGGIFKADDMQGHERYAGFAQAVTKYGGCLDDSVIWYGTNDRESLFLSEYNLLERLKDCSGVVCYNDQIAYQVIQLLTKHNRRVPEDVAVFGFDDSNVSEYSPIKISTFRHPKEELGRRAAEKIIAMAERGAKEASLVMDMEMVLKKSAL